MVALLSDWQCKDGCGRCTAGISLSPHVMPRPAIKVTFTSTCLRRFRDLFYWMCHIGNWLFWSLRTVLVGFKCYISYALNVIIFRRFRKKCFEYWISLLCFPEDEFPDSVEDQKSGLSSSPFPHTLSYLCPQCWWVFCVCVEPRWMTMTGTYENSCVLWGGRCVWSKAVFARRQPRWPSFLSN